MGKWRRSRFPWCGVSSTNNRKEHMPKLLIKHINRRDLARKINVSESYVSCILRQKRNMNSLKTFRKMAIALGVTMEKLLEIIERDKLDAKKRR
jgi:transcriptional regulator with XRE-family HTH domain